MKILLPVAMALLGLGAPQQQNTAPPSTWIQLQPGITARSSVVNGHRLVEYHAANYMASAALRALLKERHFAVVPARWDQSKGRFVQAQLTSCMSRMTGGETPGHVQANITVNCATGVNIQGQIQTINVVGGGVPEGTYYYTGTTHLGALLNQYCQTESTTDPSCKGSFTNAQANYWDIQESWSADDGESGAAEQCGDNYPGCPNPQD